MARLVRRVTDYDKDGIVQNEFELQVMDKCSEYELHLNHNYSFVKVYRKFMPPYKTKSFLTYFYFLCRFLGRNSNAVLRFYEKRNVYADKEDIAFILGLAKSYSNRFLKESMDIGAIAKSKIGNNAVFIVNPVYAYNGRYPNVSMYQLFKNSTDFIKSLNPLDIERIKHFFKEDVIGVENEWKRRYFHWRYRER